ncbi:hypothetical protein Nepgr_007361 [Nepenthes gracilis]|uniref:Pentatricopeptide repeat-containing protein n=1 Tax=Nepenthes gracilis TaxID=150966 RepID=A0AAD3XIF4_NEPGR|nr:hypothetical protein Nepgr_007361 [Nepenthes gracilis]
MNTRRLGILVKGYFCMTKWSPELKPICIFLSFEVLCTLRCVQEHEKTHERSLKSGLGNDIMVVNSLIGLYFACGRVESAQKLFDKQYDRDVLKWLCLQWFAVKGLRFSGESLVWGMSQT